MKFFSKLILFALVIISVTACSTVLNTTTQDIAIKTNPANAKITVGGKKFGTSPQVINIDRGSNHTIKLELEGHETYETQITRKISFWFWGNVLNGFIPGMLTDMFTGAMYNLLPEIIEVDLTPAKQPEKSGKK